MPLRSNVVSAHLGSLNRVADTAISSHGGVIFGVGRYGGEQCAGNGRNLL
jgi:hypothetical protein